jgi:predicted acyl esterase
MISSSRRYLILVAMIAIAPTHARAGVVPSVFGGRIPCVVQPSGVQYCAGTLATRVETWDGVPLDASVTLPPAAVAAPYPLIVDIHGWSIGKSPTPFTADALDGYAVLSYTARGFHLSCGTAASRVPDPTLSNPNACNDRGWIRLADARYEVRDTQYLAGRLADEGIAIPDRIGARGASYGGGQSMMLAALKDRVMLPDGTLVPWTSPMGTPMRIAAAAPMIPWSDLAYSLVPNGRTLDYLDFSPYGSVPGIEKKSLLNILYNLGIATGFYAPSGADPDADLVAWKTRLDAGEPYEGDGLLVHALDEEMRHHSAFYIDDSEEPAPLFIYNAFTDDLFPIDESLRYWRKIRKRYPGAEMSLQYADAFGHWRANVLGSTANADARMRDLFARHLKGTGAPLPPLEVYTQVCGGSPVGPIGAADWDAIHPGEVRFSGASPQSFTQAAGIASNATATDPLGPGTSCRSTPSTDDPAAATYRLPAATGAGYTLMGSPTVIVALDLTGTFPGVAARLWDVGTGGTQTLVAQALYRPRNDGTSPEVFQLHANGWLFAAGHVPKLELLGQSAPYGRPSNGTFTITVESLELRLPVLDAPDGVTILSPAPPVVPPNGEPLVCPPAPHTGCRDAGSSRIVILDDVLDRRDRIQWKAKGAGTAVADFGDPRITTGYALCVYDGGGTLLSTAAAPSGRTCGAKPCWSRTERGFSYRDKDGSPSGVAGLTLAVRGPTDTRIAVDGRGVDLQTPGVPVALPVTVELLNAEGTCWQSSYAVAQRNTFGHLIAKK